MFKPETLKKYMEKAQEYIRKWEDETLITISVSDGNRKIGRVMNISTLPIHTCGNCSGCSKYCYDIKACMQYTNVINARAKNTVLAERNLDEYFNQLWNKMARRKKNFYLRFHVGGEIPSYEYLCKMIETARLFPHFTIWTYTKMYFLVAEYVRLHGDSKAAAIPENMTIMLSEWRGMPLYNPYALPEFRVVFVSEGETFPSDCTWVCPGNCDICKEKRRGCVVGETTYAADH